MKSKITLGIGFFGIIIFVIIAAYLWYLYFLDFNNDGMFNDNGSTQGRIVMVDLNGVNATNEESKESGENTPSYLFRVDNRKTASTRYTLYIEDTPYNQVNDGCSMGTTLSRSDLSYQLKLNGAVVKMGKMTEISNNILDNRVINANISNNYELTVWINEEALEWEGKHYHYKVVLKEVEA